MNIPSIIVLVVYVLVMFGIGFWSMKRTKDVGDFFLGGRSLGPWMSAFAFGTTYFSAVLFIGYAGKLGWGFGIHTMWIVIGNTIVGTILSWWILAGRTRDMTVRLNALTMPEFLSARFDSKGLKIFSAFAMFVFLVPYSASVYMGLSYLFEKALGVPYGTALIFLAVITGVYLVMGGYFAVAVSDFIRGIVEFVGVLLMLFILVQAKGGFGATSAQLLSSNMTKPGVLDMSPGLLPWAKLGMPQMVLDIPWFNIHIVMATPAFLQFAVPGFVILLSLVLITSFGPWSLPQMVQKFYSIRSKADVTRAMTIAGIFSLFMAGGAYYIGALTHLYYAKGLPAAIMQNGKPNLDLLMPVFIMEHVPYWLVLIILLLIFSASMSSLSSLVLVSSSAIAIDVYGTFVDRHKNQQTTMLLMRIFCAVFVALSLWIAMSKIDVIVNLMVMSWGSLAGVFMAPYIYGLFWKRTTKAGVYAGIITGLLSAFTLFWAWGSPGVPVAGAITMFLPMIVVPVVSWMTKPPSEEIVKKAFNEGEMETKTKEEMESTI